MENKSLQSQGERNSTVFILHIAWPPLLIVRAWFEGLLTGSSRITDSNIPTEENEIF